MSDTNENNPPLPAMRTMQQDIQKLAQPIAKNSEADTPTKETPSVRAPEEITSDTHEQHTVNSLLSNQDDVFDVSHAFDTSTETGTIITDKKHTHGSFGDQMKEAFSQWLQGTRKSLDSILPAPKTPEATIEPAKNRAAIIKEAARNAQFAPADDHDIVVKKIQHVAKEVTPPTSFVIKNEYTKLAPTWSMETPPPPEIKTPETHRIQRDQPVSHKDALFIAPDIPHRTIILNETSPENTEPVSKKPLFSFFQPYGTGATDSNKTQQEPELHKNEKAIPSPLSPPPEPKPAELTPPVSVIEKPVPTAPPQLPPPEPHREVSPATPPPIPELVSPPPPPPQPEYTSPSREVPLATLPPETEPVLPPPPPPQPVYTPPPPAIAPSGPGVIPALTLSEAWRSVDDIVADVHTETTPVSEPPPRYIPPPAYTPPQPEPAPTEVFVPQEPELTTPEELPEQREQSALSRIAQSRGIEGIETAPRTEERIVQGIPTNFLVIVTVAGIAILGGMLTAILFFTGGNESPLARAPSIPSLLPTDAVVAIPLGSDRNALLMALTAEGSRGEARVTQLYPARSLDGANFTTPATTEEIFTVLAPRAPGAFIRSLGPETMIGTLQTTTRAPFIILTSNTFDVAFAGMLAWEPAMSTDLAPFFGAPVAESFDPNKGGRTETTGVQFSDTRVDNVSVRVLYGATGTERIVYGFVGRNTILITTTKEAFGALRGLLR